jgi:hypothetical protein
MWKDLICTSEYRYDKKVKVVKDTFGEFSDGYLGSKRGYCNLCEWKFDSDFARLDKRLALTRREVGEVGFTRLLT